MNKILIIGGPAVVALTAGFLVWSGIVTFGEIEGLEHKAGAEKGSTFKTEVESVDSGDFTEIEGLDMEIENESIEYRESDEPTTVRKLNGLNKYANITVRWPTGFDTDSWKFIFDGEARLDECPNCDDNADPRVEIVEESETEFDGNGGGEMYQIDPPVLVIPAR